MAIVYNKIKEIQIGKTMFEADILRISLPYVEYIS